MLVVIWSGWTGHSLRIDCDEQVEHQQVDGKCCATRDCGVCVCGKDLLVTLAVSEHVASLSIFSRQDKLLYVRSEYYNIPQRDLALSKSLDYYPGDIGLYRPLPANDHPRMI